MAAVAQDYAAAQNSLIIFVDGTKGDNGFSAALQALLEGKNPPKPTENLVAYFFADKKLQNLILSKDDAQAFREAVVRPFTAPSLGCNSALSAGLVARMIIWWKERLPDHEKLRADMTQGLYMLLMRGEEYHYMGSQYRYLKKVISERKAAKLNTGRPVSDTDNMMNLVCQATSCRNSGGCNALFEIGRAHV